MARLLTRSEGKWGDMNEQEHGNYYLVWALGPTGAEGEMGEGLRGYHRDPMKFIPGI